MGGLLTNTSRLSINFTAMNFRIFLNDSGPKTEEDVPKTMGDKCLQLSICVRLEMRKGKLISPTYPSESKAHFPV